MSLLLEALKKAEKAKEEAQQRARASAEADDPAAQISAFDPESTVLDDARHVTTRDDLPDISSPLEILSDDLRPKTAVPAAPMELRLADEAPPEREAGPSPRRDAARASARAQDAQNQQNRTANAERATAQRVFEAKFKERNPRLPFYITVGVLSLFGIGTGFYFWLQLSSTPSLAVNTNPPRAADEKPIETAALKPAVIPGATGTAPSAAATIPGLPSAPPATAAAPATAPAPAAAPAAGTAPPPVAAPAPATAAAVPAPAAPVAPAPLVAASAPRSAPAAPRSRSAARSSAEERPLDVRRNALQIHPQVASGYSAYLAGDFAKARADYQQVLREEATNRDALLGLAAVEMRAQRFDLADGYYRRVLIADPRDAHAQAGMVGLRSQQLDPVAVESRMKSLLATDREANVLYFTLGNQYAQQGRWAEAQQAYFKAFTADPDNADFAFNVAVSLDQLHKPQLALEYYRRALALAQKRSASFDSETARTRAQQLSR